MERTLIRLETGDKYFCTIAIWLLLWA